MCESPTVFGNVNHSGMLTQSIAAAVRSLQLWAPTRTSLVLWPIKVRRNSELFVIMHANLLVANNIRGHWKRCFCSATFVGVGGIGGIIGSLVFRSQDAPRYLPGIYACIVSQVLVLAIVLLLSVKFRRDNKNQAAGTLIIERDDQFRYTI